MEAFNSALNASSIVNILTLRYDPSINPILPKKTWNDFETNNEIPNILFIEKQIEHEIKEKINSLGSKKISIALSGGVDSTLVLALLRKSYPDINIDAISIKFANSIDETSISPAMIMEYIYIYESGIFCPILKFQGCKKVINRKIYLI